MVEEKDDLDFTENNDEIITVNEWENKPESNILPKGRYKFKVRDTSTKHSDSGNELLIVDLIIEGKRLRDWLIMRDANGKRHSMSFKFYNFLFSVGIRNTQKQFNIKKSDLIGKSGLCDVIVKNDTENSIQNYSPIEEATAPVSDVPPENIEENKKEKAPKEEGSSEDL